MQFTRIERAWARSVFAGIYPRRVEGPLRVGAGDIDVESGLDQMERAWPAGTLWTLRLALWVTVFAPVVALRRARWFPALAPGDQARVLEWLYQSNVYVIRSLVVLLKTTGGMIFGGAPGVRPAIAPGQPAEGHALVQLRRGRALDAVSAL